MTETAEKRLEVLESSGYEQTNFDVVVNMSRSLDEDRIWLTLVYNGDLWDEEMMTRLGRYYTVACERMLRGLEECHDMETLLSSEEVHQQLVEWNGAMISYERAPVHEQIAAQARRTPEAVAVVCGELSLSYAELNDKAERLARDLAEAGVEMETRVGIFLRPFGEVMDCVLGVHNTAVNY